MKINPRRPHGGRGLILLALALVVSIFALTGCKNNPRGKEANRESIDHVQFPDPRRENTQKYENRKGSAGENAVREEGSTMTHGALKNGGLLNDTGHDESDVDDTMLIEGTGITLR